MCDTHARRRHGLRAADTRNAGPVVGNGIAVSNAYHAAFDNHLIGIDPDGRVVHISERLLMLHDGPLLEQSPNACAEP